jgi:hypothetical protein
MVRFVATKLECCDNSFATETADVVAIQLMGNKLLTDK